MMFTNLFNCHDCEVPFDCKEGEPRLPFYHDSHHVFRCGDCATSYAVEKETQPRRGLMDFLNQPAFKKTDNGYKYTLPLKNPICFGCDSDTGIFEGSSAYPLVCGHYLCQECDDHGINNSCKNCGIQSEVVFYPADNLLARFSTMVKLAQNKALNDQLAAREKENRALEAEKLRLTAIVAKQEKADDRKNVQKCGDCGIELPVERLYKCKDCDTINCGNCCFDSHREHSVEKLLGIELDQLQKQNDKRYTENLEGLQGNLKFLATAIDHAVEKVLIAGKDRLTHVKECTQYENAKNIVATVDTAANEFEQHCEEYIPVARVFATRLTELGERLMKEEKK